jgi:eukaryotic-like serine/threonine-protein kinase
MRYMQRTVLDDRYVLLETIGGGGMAKVYLARDQVLDRDVALKVMREAYASDQEFVERFRREARSAASLAHPSIVQIYDQGRAEDGTYYIAMEYVPGGTLKEHIKESGSLDPGEAAGIAARVAEALEVAHERGVVHRDIKPQNVLLTPSGTVKVVDFGIARAASATSVTRTSLVLGTAGYMSPEQAAGERVGPASDLYSLGVVLYEMLTGEVPYDAETPVAVAVKHLNEPPRHPREANPRVPEELDALTVKLMAKKPEDRYSSAAELARDLERIKAGLPPLAASLEPEAATVPVSPGSPNTGHTRVAPTAVATGKPAAPAVRRRRRGLLPLLVLLAALALLGVAAWALSQGLGVPGAQQVEVPGVVGLSQEEAQSRLDKAGLRSEVREEESSAQEAGVVLDQSPSGGESADRGSSVELTVGAGPSLVQVPDLEVPDQVEGQLAEVGLELGTVTEAPSDTIPAGYVSVQDPTEGTLVEPGTAVDITISTGPQQTTVPLPQDTQQAEPSQQQPELSQPELSQPELSQPELSQPAQEPAREPESSGPGDPGQSGPGSSGSSGTPAQSAPGSGGPGGGASGPGGGGEAEGGDD